MFLAAREQSGRSKPGTHVDTAQGIKVFLLLFLQKKKIFSEENLAFIDAIAWRRWWAAGQPTLRRGVRSKTEAIGI